jgi:NADH dehydrogenase [ubiquinone] 1 alpha subcomplex assembly factor 7
MTENLTEFFHLLIKRHGPISVADYFANALGHNRHGYYRTRDPFGVAGDFTTAPEISQVFGELIGLWTLQCWRQMGEPAAFNLVELGPGRGTLMADLMRAGKTDPAFQAAADIHLVETSTVLRQAQNQTLGQHNPTWHGDLATLLPGPTILLANEFLDALPIQQFEMCDGEWFERLVDLDAQSQLTFTLAQNPHEDVEVGDFPKVENGTIFEVSPAREAMVGRIAKRLKQHGGYALLIDYGHARPGQGDSLQAVSGHEFVDVLHNPGNVDLSSHVDFTALRRPAEAAGARSYPLLTQARFLGNLGIALRAEQLLKGMDEDGQEDFQAGIDLLISPDNMGEMFKVLALSHPDHPAPAGFEE